MKNLKMVLVIIALSVLVAGCASTSQVADSIAQDTTDKQREQARESREQKGGLELGKMGPPAPAIVMSNDMAYDEFGIVHEDYCIFRM